MRKQTQALTFGAMMAALIVAVLYLGSILPSMELVMDLVGGLIVGVVVAAMGLRVGLLCCVAAGILALILIPSKGEALLFLVAFGLYPVVKSWLERKGNRLVEWVGKFVFYNAVLVFCMVFLKEFLLEGVPVPMPVVFLFGNAFFLLYDYSFSRWMTVLEYRIIGPWRRRKR
jgi:hypothetical protein